ncbi:MAG TPA: prepilin-type N-terminal cleavage/methylation domain-containing protein [Gemmatimonadaceae bacterium]|nr:prepilin-type N-terminal cleavage/methylation domain-containing protein [Gemmatimonadaceae bacterium]
MARSQRPPAPRRGVTLVELLVALVVAAVGLLALSGSGTQSWRRRREADAAIHATALARLRVERLAASCATSTASIAHPDGLAAWWRGARAGGALLIEAGVSWPTTRGRDSVALHGSRWCAP